MFISKYFSHFANLLPNLQVDGVVKYYRASIILFVDFKLNFNIIFMSIVNKSTYLVSCNKRMKLHCKKLFMIFSPIQLQHKLVRISKLNENEYLNKIGKSNQIVKTAFFSLNNTDCLVTRIISDRWMLALTNRDFCYSITVDQ